MNYRKEYLLKRGNFGDKLMDIGSYIPLLGLPLDNVLNKRVEEDLGKRYLGDNFYFEVNKFKEQALGKDNYHAVASLLISIFFLQKFLNYEPKISKEKIEKKNFLENTLNFKGSTKYNDKTFNFADYLA